MKTNEKKEANIIADNVTGVEITGDTEARQYVIDNYVFILNNPDPNKKDIWFSVTDGRFNTYNVETDDMDSEEAEEYHSEVIALAEAAEASVQAVIDTLIDDDKYYICYTEHLDKTQGRSGYDSWTGYRDEAYNSYAEAEEYIPTEERLSGYHCTFVIVKGFAAAKKY